MRHFLVATSRNGWTAVRRTLLRRRAALGSGLLLLFALCVGAPEHGADATDATPYIVNPDFETGDLSGWVTTGTTFDAGVTTANDWGWGCCFGQQGRHHVWGFRTAGDAATGTLRSMTFRLAGTGRVSALVAGGDDPANLYVALVRASDGAELFRATGNGTEAYRRVTWDARAHLGVDLYILAVDRATGGWGHINLDDVRTYESPQHAGVVAHWAFDEGRGFVARDRIGGVDDTVQYVFRQAQFKPASDPLWRTGPTEHGVLARSLLFDGYSTWVTRRADRAPAISDALTVEAWVAPRAFEWGDEGRLSGIVDKHDDVLAACGPPERAKFDIVGTADVPGRFDP